MNVDIEAEKDYR